MLRVLAAVFAIAACLSGCGPPVTPDRMRLLESEFSALGKPEHSVEIRHISESKSNSGVVGSSYRAASDEAALRAYYDPAFVRNGWIIADRVDKVGISVTCYSKSDYFGALEFATDPTLGYTYAIELTIGQSCR